MRGIGIMQGRFLPPIKGHVPAFPEKRWRGEYQNLYRSGATKKILCVLAGIIIATFLIITWKQVSNWKNSITLYQYATRVTDKKYPDSILVYNNVLTKIF